MSDGQPGGMNPALKIILIVAGVLLLLTCGVVVALGLLVRAGVNEFEGQMLVESTKTQMQEIGAALTAHRLEHDVFPDSLDALVGPSGYLETDMVPVDAWGRPFVYATQGDEAFTLLSLGADGAEGGEGENADISFGDLQRR